MKCVTIIGAAGGSCPLTCHHKKALNGIFQPKDIRIGGAFFDSRTDPPTKEIREIDIFKSDFRVGHTADIGTVSVF